VAAVGDLNQGRARDPAMQFLGFVGAAQAVDIGGDDQGRLGDLAQPVQVAGPRHGRLAVEGLAA